MSSSNSRKDLSGVGGSGTGAHGAGSSSRPGTASGAGSGLGKPSFRSDSTRPVSSRAISRAGSSSTQPPTPHGDLLLGGSSSAGRSLEPTPLPTPTGGGVPHAPVYTQSNALFDADSSMTPSVRVREYSPALAADYSNPPGGVPAGNGLTGVAGLQQLSQKLQDQLHIPDAYHVQQQGSSCAKPGLPYNSSSSGGGPRSCKVYLDKAGDLFTPPDQAHFDAGLSRDVAGAKAEIPGWNYSRPFLTGAFLMQPDLLSQETAGDPPPDLGGLPAPAQEQALVNDLLHTFMGISGKYIKPQLLTSGLYPQLGWKVVVPLEPCMQEQVERLLPMSEYVVIIQRFIETRSWMEHPLVVQALAAAMRGLLQQWLLLVAQLEHQMRCGRLTLQALVYHCQQPLASLRLLASIAGEAASSCMSSATLLNLLCAKAAALAGDQAGQRLVQKLLEAAAEPYFGMLELWLTSGELDDPYKEFMVEGDATITKDTLTDHQQLAYWAHRYVLRKDVMRDPSQGVAMKQHDGSVRYEPPPDVPEFLAPAADAILATGKHLNAIRACGRPVPPPLASAGGALRYDPSGAYMASIQAAKARASAGLMQVMMEEMGLLGWLTSLKRFFLLEQGDLLVHLLSFAAEELSSTVGKISRPRLQSLLELAVRSSSCAGDPHMENLGYTFDPRELPDIARAVLHIASPGSIASAQSTRRGGGKDSNLCGWQAFTFTFTVDWPVSLVVGRPQLLQYQLLFKHLFTLKYWERQLNGVWLQLQQTRRLPRQHQEAFKPWHQLCSRLNFLVTEVLRYVTIDVLEPLWGGMRVAMRQATSIDEVMACHQQFLDRAVEGALLDALPVAVKLGELLVVGRRLCEESVRLWPKEEAAGGSDGGAKPAGAKLGRYSTFARTQGALLKAAADQSLEHTVQDLQQSLQKKSRGLLDAMQEVYRALLAGPVTQDSGSSQAEGAQERLVVRRVWGREELEALSDLIERLDVEHQHLTPAMRAARALQRDSSNRAAAV